MVEGRSGGGDGSRIAGLRSGAVSGIATALAFTVLHEFLISDIWFSWIPMVLAGAACGLCLSWTYGVMFPAARRSTWWAYVGLYVILLLALGAVSVWVFDPVVPMAVLIAANEPPTELIARAMPLTAVFIVAASGAVSGLWGRTIAQFLSCLVTSAVLIVLLGINVSVIGLVRMSDESFGVLGEFFALIVVIMVGFGAIYHGLERRRSFLASEAPAQTSSGGS